MSCVVKVENCLFLLFQTLVSVVNSFHEKITALEEKTSQLEKVSNDASKATISRSMTTVWQRWTRLRNVAQEQEKILEGAVQEWKGFNDKVTSGLGKSLFVNCTKFFFLINHPLVTKADSRNSSNFSQNILKRTMEDLGLESLPPRFALFFYMHTCIVNTELFWFLVILQNLILCISLLQMIYSSLIQPLKITFFPEEYKVAISKFMQCYHCLSLLTDHVSLFFISYLSLFICHCPLFYVQTSGSLGMRIIVLLNVSHMPNMGVPWGRALGPMAIKILNAKKYKQPFITCEKVPYQVLVHLARSIIRV